MTQPYKSDPNSYHRFNLKIDNPAHKLTINVLDVVTAVTTATEFDAVKISNSTSIANSVDFKRSIIIDKSYLDHYTSKIDLDNELLISDEFYKSFL